MPELKIVIKSTQLHQETTTKGNVINKQFAALDAGDGGFPLPFSLNVKQPYPIGEYRLGSPSFKQGRFGGLEFNDYSMTLLPIAANK